MNILLIEELNFRGKFKDPVNNTNGGELTDIDVLTL